MQLRTTFPRRPINRELRYPAPSFGEPGVLQRLIDLGCCPKCFTKVEPDESGKAQCKSCNLTFDSKRSS